MIIKEGIIYKKSNAKDKIKKHAKTALGAAGAVGAIAYGVHKLKKANTALDAANRLGSNIGALKNSINKTNAKTIAAKINTHKKAIGRLKGISNVELAKAAGAGVAAAGLGKYAYDHATEK